MGIKQLVVKTAEKAADKVAKLGTLSPEQLQEIDNKRYEYLSQMPDPNDSLAEFLTAKLLAANSVEIYNAYLDQLKDLYVPVAKEAEYGKGFDASKNIRFFNITKWVVDKEENSLEKLVNVYEVLSNEECNISLVFHRTVATTHVYLAVTNTKNANDNVASDNYRERLADAIRGNFPGSEWKQDRNTGTIPCLNNNIPYSVAIASNVPAEKSEKFISQTIEKLLDGNVPDRANKEYIIILMATPVKDIEQRKLRLGEMYSGLNPYSSWQTSFTYNEQSSVGSSATVGVNVGASAGIQNGQNHSVTDSQATTDTENNSVGTTNTNTVGESEGGSTTDTTSTTSTDSQGNTTTHNEGTNSSITETDNSSTTGTVSIDAKVVDASASTTKGHSTGETTGQSFSDSLATSITKSVADSVSQAVTKTAQKTITSAVGETITKTLGKAVTKTAAVTQGVSKSLNFGANFGANFARSSTMSMTLGKSEGIQQSYVNFNIKHALELLESQMKRYEQSTALGMWDFAAYVLSEDQNVANNVAHSYIALTQGEESYLSHAAINLWRGDMGDESGDTKEICAYLRDLRHPIFGLNPKVLNEDNGYMVYPASVTATTSLSGKELAYSLNFPRKSVPGLPVIECAEFGRNISSFDITPTGNEKIALGSIFHMHHEEREKVELSADSLTSHTFITGSTGSGKSNTIYQILNEARDNGANFMVIEPAKGEYKHVFGGDKDVTVYGTNPKLSSLLRINPFSFPDGIHILEHLDRLVEIFNVCWPMYAAMPAVLKSAIEKSYIDCGWNLTRSENKYGEYIYPSFVDVARNIKEIIETSEYDAENKGAYKGSLLTRLESLTNGINGMVFTCDDIDLKDLFDKDVIIDLSRVGSSETKSLIMGMLVLKLQEYRMTSSIGMNSELKHLTVIEEAHNLLRRTSVEQSSESANLRGKSVEMLSNAIAEMRTYGEGFIIADQAPGLLDLSVIRNTNTKIIMRLPDQSDRELVGRAAGLNDNQIIELAKLPRGVAAVYQNEWVQPVLCKVTKYDGEINGYSFDPSENEPYMDVEAKIISESLLDCVMSKELLQKDNKQAIIKLKSKVVRSKLDSSVKKSLMDYIESSDEASFDALRRLVYEFLKASDAIRLSEEQTELTDWVNSVVDKLSPSIKDYSKMQINLALSLILYEQSLRDREYTDLFRSFVEVYKNEGGVF